MIKRDDVMMVTMMILFGFQTLFRYQVYISVSDVLDFCSFWDLKPCMYAQYVCTNHHITSSLFCIEKSIRLSEWQWRKLILVFRIHEFIYGCFVPLSLTTSTSPSVDFSYQYFTVDSWPFFFCRTAS
jgi:hypothetical protein